MDVSPSLLWIPLGIWLSAFTWLFYLYTRYQNEEISLRFKMSFCVGSSYRQILYIYIQTAWLIKSRDFARISENHTHISYVIFYFIFSSLLTRDKKSNPMVQFFFDWYVTRQHSIHSKQKLEKVLEGKLTDETQQDFQGV